jgi:hypothetical protein
MQLCNPAATCRQRWSWSENVARGANLLQQKRNEATAYLNHHAPGGHYPNNLGLGDADVVQRETLQRYNGGRYWQWDNTASRWVANPPQGNNYVQQVLACH